jgi:uncharacterized protein (DUF983 family)
MMSHPIFNAADKPEQEQKDGRFWWKNDTTCHAPAPKVGERCPACQQGKLAYDSFFNLVCEVCGKTAVSGAFT